MSKQNRYVLGYVDEAGSGKKNCEAAITWELKNGEFSMCAEIWNPRKTDCLRCGQCVEEVAAMFPDNSLAQRMVAVWRAWHLNDMMAGSPAQEAWLAKNPLPDDMRGKHYEWASTALEKAYLNPDPDYMHEGKPYAYGSAWLKRELPAEVLAEIARWGTTNEKGGDPFAEWLANRYDFKAEYQRTEEKMDWYFCTFTTKAGRQPKRILSTEWQQGLGHRKDARGRDWDPREHGRYTYEWSHSKSAPAAKAVMDAALGDARAYAENGDLADFMENYGYEDLRAARRIWQACETQHAKLREFLGAEFYTLLNSEDMPSAA